MNESSSQPHTERRTDQQEDEEEQESSANNMLTPKRLCDFCGQRKAILYCRPDSAKLCLSCDREVHSTNQLFIKHTRSLLCDSCDSSPASILCPTENLVLCQNCDWEKHSRSVSSIHERRPLEGFSGRPSAYELLSIVGLDDDLRDKSLNLSENDCLVDVLSDVVVWDTPSIVTLDDLIFPSDSEHNFQAMGVPPLPKNRKATCGHHKDEILRQLRELLRLEPDMNSGIGDIEQLHIFQCMVPKQNLLPRNAYPGCEHDAEESTDQPPFIANASQWCNDCSEAASQDVLSEDANKTSVIVDSLNSVHECESHDLFPVTSHTLPVLSKNELKGPERETAISRYKEKRKSRRYDKHIRYESRKVRAESRVRIKGRFAKMDG